MDKKSRRIIAAIMTGLMLMMSFAEVPAVFAAGEAGDEPAMELQDEAGASGVEGPEVGVDEQGTPETPGTTEGEEEPAEEKADYGKVTDAVNQANAVNRDQYTADSIAKLDAAVAAVVYDLPVSRQLEVDAMAQAITDAIAALVKKDPSEPVIERNPMLIEGNYYYIRFYTTTNNNDYYKNMEGKTKVKLDGRWYQGKITDVDGTKYVTDGGTRAESDVNALVKKGWKFDYFIKATNGTTADPSDDEYITPEDSPLTFDQIGQKGKNKGYNLKVENGKAYYLEVKATSPNGEQVTCNSLDRIVRYMFIDAPENVKVKCDDDDNRATLKWKKVDKAIGYAIYISTNGKCPSKPTKYTKNTEYTKALAGPKTYTFFVKSVFYNKAATTGGVGGTGKGHEIKTVSAACKGDDTVKIKGRILDTGIRTIKWYAKAKYTAPLYSNSGCSKKKGTLAKGTKVYCIGKYPSHLPRGAHPTRYKIQFTNKKGKTVTGYIRYGTVKHVSGEVAYKGGKAYDYSEAVKEDYVNEKGFSSSSKYLIWMNTYTQRVNIFTGKKGHWKLLRTDRCTSGEYYHYTGLGSKYKIHRHQETRIRNFINSTSKYYYKKLSYFSKGNSFHTPCWRLDNNKSVNHVKSNLQPGTKGCVRMTVPAATWIYNNIPLGTKVITH
ncbi:MAG: L,D-transpeptidase [Eubacterium sp.]|nr:L,D-transpeptidase [Eubacterium sp.]